MTQWLFDLGNSRLKCAQLHDDGSVGDVRAMAYEEGLADALAATVGHDGTSAVLASVASPELGLPVPPLLVGLTHAQHRNQACALGRDELLRHELTAFVVVLPALGMPHQSIPARQRARRTCPVRAAAASRRCPAGVRGNCAAAAARTCVSPARSNAHWRRPPVSRLPSPSSSG